MKLKNIFAIAVLSFAALGSVNAVYNSYQAVTRNPFEESNQKLDRIIQEAQRQNDELSSEIKANTDELHRLMEEGDALKEKMERQRAEIEAIPE